MADSTCNCACDGCCNKKAKPAATDAAQIQAVRTPEPQPEAEAEPAKPPAENLVH